MNIEIRLYKRYDVDLIALYNAGYPISVMLREAILAYASGRGLHYLVDEITPFDEKGASSARVRIRIPDTETDACQMICNVKKGFRNMFCKTLLRNTLLCQNLSGFFRDEKYMHLHAASINAVPVDAYSDIVTGSSIRKKEYTFSFAGRTITSSYVAKTAAFSESVLSDKKDAVPDLTLEPMHPEIPKQKTEKPSISVDTDADIAAFLESLSSSKKEEPQYAAPADTTTRPDVSASDSIDAGLDLDAKLLDMIDAF